MDEQNPSIGELVARIRAGDKAAEIEFMQKYEPMVRQCIRRKFQWATSIRREHDSEDFSQLTMLHFFEAFLRSSLEIRDECHLVNLLKRIVHRQVLMALRAQNADRRDIHRTGDHAVDLDSLPARVEAQENGPGSEELARVLADRVCPEERWLLEERAQGHTWSDLGAELGLTEDGVRKRHVRIIARLRQELKVPPPSL